MASDHTRIDDELVKESYRQRALNLNANGAVLIPSNDITAERRNTYYDYISKRIIKSHLTPTKKETILDFGSGLGRISSYLASSSSKIVGVDNSIEMLNIARRNAPSNVEYVHINAAAFPLNDNSFDKGFAFWVLASISDELLDTILPEIYRVLKPGGNFMFFEQVVNAPLYEGGVHKKRLTQEYIDMSVKHGFSLVEHHPVIRVPSYGMSIWNKYSFLPTLALPLLYKIETSTVMRKPEYADYYTTYFCFIKK